MLEPSKMNHPPAFLKDYDREPKPEIAYTDDTLSTLLESFCFLNKARFYTLPKWMTE